MDSTEEHQSARLAEVIESVARARGYSLDALRSSCRRQHLARTRQQAMLAAHEEGFSCVEIGRYLNRDHTTVVHGVKQARGRSGA